MLEGIDVLVLETLLFHAFGDGFHQSGVLVVLGDYIGEEVAHKSIEKLEIIAQKFRDIGIFDSLDEQLVLLSIWVLSLNLSSHNQDTL